MITNVPDPEFFENTFKECFNDLIVKYDYLIIAEERRHKYCSYLKYHNSTTNLIIDISHEPYYTNYGFTISIVNSDLNEYKIIYNLPWEKEDSNCNFVETAFNTLFSDKHTILLLKGQEWFNGTRISKGISKDQSIYTKIQIKGQQERYYKDGKEIDFVEWSNRPQ